MRKTWIAKAGFAALVVGLACIAPAQSSGLSARIGLLFPTEKSIASSWFAGGIDYKLNTFSPTRAVGVNTGYFGISADYYNYAGNTNIPVVLNYNYREGSLVYSIGAGIEFYDVPDFSAGSGTGFDAQAGVTYDLSRSSSLPLFVQAKYYLASRSELRGVGVYVGVHF
jgi:hypothetical protein